MPPPPPRSAPSPAPEIVEVRCAGCGETLEVEAGLTEFICPDCAMPQALPPELMPPPPPRRRRALPLPRGVADARGARLPCAACGAVLSVPHGLGRFACPLCGVELAVDRTLLRQYLASSAASAVSVVAPPAAVPLTSPPEAQGGPANYSVHIDQAQVQRHSEVIARHGKQKTGCAVEPRAISMEQEQIEPLDQTVHVQQTQETPRDEIHAEQVQVEPRSKTNRKRKKKGLVSSSNEGPHLRRSKRLAKESAGLIDTETIQQKAASPDQNLSHPPDIEKIIANLRPCSLPQRQMPQASNESENLDLTTQPASSNPGISQAERFPCCHSQLYPSEVSGALVKPSSNSSHEHQMPQPSSSGRRPLDVTEPQVRPDSRQTQPPQRPSGLNAGNGHLHMEQEQVEPPNQVIHGQQAQELSSDGNHSEQVQVESLSKNIAAHHKQKKKGLMGSPNEGSHLGDRSFSGTCRQMTLAAAYSRLAASLPQPTSTLSATTTSPSVLTMPQFHCCHLSPSYSQPPSHLDSQVSLPPSLSVSGTRRRNSRRHHQPGPVQVAAPSTGHPLPVSIMTDDSADNDHQEAPRVDNTDNDHQQARPIKYRGKTSCAKILRRRSQGIRPVVAHNEKGQPVGDYAVELETYLGRLARTFVPIHYQTWKQVPKEIRKQLWKDIQYTFTLSDQTQYHIFQSMGKKWRQYKYELKHNIVCRFIDEPEYRDQNPFALQRPPAGHPTINEQEWQLFVAHCTSEKSKETRKLQQSRRAQYDTPHRTSRRSFANKELDLRKERSSDKPIERAELWKIARQNKKGEYVTEKTKKIGDKIDELYEQRARGEFTEIGMNDVLTQAIGKAEHYGRVRGVGAYVTWRDFFHRPAGGIRKLQEDLLRFQNIRENEWKQKFTSLEAKFDERFKELQKIFIGKSNFSPQYETQLSVPPQYEPQQHVPSPQQYEEPYVLTPADPYVSTTVHHGFQNIYCKLCDEMLNIVALGNIIETKGSTIHGRVFDYDVVRVSILKAIIPSYNLPYPVPPEIETVGEAVNAIVAWPKQLVIGSLASHEVAKTIK